MEIKQTRTKHFPKFNRDHCFRKSNGPKKCSGARCQQPSAISLETCMEVDDMQKKTRIQTTRWWLKTDKGDSNWEPRAGPPKLSFDLQMIRNVCECKLKKEISNAQYTWGFIWHPQLKLPFGDVCIYVSKECNWIWKFSPVLSVQTCDFSSLKTGVLNSTGRSSRDSMCLPRRGCELCI